MVVEEKTINSDKVYTGKTISVRVDTVEVPNFGYQKREIVEHIGEVCVVAITDENEIVLLKRYKKSVDEVLIELPTDKLEIGKTPKECAIKQLQEMTGYSAKNLKLIHKFYSAPSFSNQKSYVFLATGLEQENINLDNMNFEVFKFSVEECYSMIEKNEIMDSKTAIGILLSKQYI